MEPKKKDEKRARRSISLKAAAFILFTVLAATVFAGTVSFNPDPPSPMSCYQNSTCYYDFNATVVPDAPLNYSLDTPPFSQNIDGSTGVLNFTPTNGDVGVYYSVIAIAKELPSGGIDFAIINWTIHNINDVPAITGYEPENLSMTEVKENSWETYNVTASDPDLQYGDTLNFTWLLDGQVNRSLLNFTKASSTFSYANYTPDFFSAGLHNLTVNVTDNQSAWDSITWTVNVTNENRVPVFVGTIPNVSMMEDVANYSVFNLSDYFYDNDLDDYPLTYDTIFESGSGVTAYINSTEPNNVSLVPDPNEFGIIVMRFRCYDGYNYTLSNNVTINITGVNDPPTVDQLADQLTYADTLTEIQVHADDVDNDPLTYYDNTSLFDINQNTGFISFTPGTGDIGNHSILINVSDGKTNESMIFNLSIISNSAPVLGGKPLPDIHTTEGNLTTIYFNATDADLTDTISFRIDSSPSNPKFVLTTTNNSAQNASAYLSFTPDQSDVNNGPFTVTIYANDTKGASDSDTFSISVQDIQHTPTIYVPQQTYSVKTGKLATITVNATDLDGNLAVFGDNTTMFDITTQQSGPSSAKTGLINFTPNTTYLGHNWVNITINDTTGKYNWSLVLFNVTYNNPPDLPPIPDRNATEDHEFFYDVNATDPDYQDTVFYFDNSTMFNISNTTGMISFVPCRNQTGTHIINITATDGEANTSRLMNLTIGSYNDFPYWAPPLDEYYINWTGYINTTYWNETNILNYTTNTTVWEHTFYQDNYTEVHMNAEDEEYETGEFGPENTLEFEVRFINFTNASNHTVTTNITLFNTSNYDGDTGRINFTPANDQVGTYYANFTVDDTTGRKNSSTVRLKVYNVDDAPIVIAFHPNITYYLNMSENTTSEFNITATDIDYGDEVFYQWAVDGQNISGENTSSFDYYANFFSAGWRNITVLLTDTHNETTTFNWTVNVSNLNRIGWFGKIRQYNYTHFSAGLTKDNITVLPGNDGFILAHSGVAYSPTGVFESEVLDSGETNYFHKFTNITWAGNLTPPLDADFNMTFRTRTAQGLTQTKCPSTISTNYSNASTYTIPGSVIISDDERCIQYRAEIETNNTAETPAINDVTIGYGIADWEIYQSTNNASWVDLDTYFYDPDTDDNITYNVTDVNGSRVSSINMSIEPSNNKVYITTDDTFLGSVELIFHMFDGYNSTDSNVVTINVSEVPQQLNPIIIPVGGGGGAVSNPVPYEVPKYVSTPVSFRLITPKLVTTYVNDTMEIPLNIFNSNFTMENLEIKAKTDNENVILKLSKDFIPKLEPNAKEFITLTVNSYKTFGNYDIVIEAKAEATSVAEDGTEKKSEFTEKSKIFVNSLLKAEGNDTQVNTKLAFAEDLLSTNQECLELNEFIGKARNLIEEGRTNEAEIMLGQIVESCKYLIAPREKEAEMEMPAKVYGMSRQSFFIMLTAAILTLLVAIGLIIGWMHMKKKRKVLLRRKY